MGRMMREGGGVVLNEPDPSCYVPKVEPVEQKLTTTSRRSPALPDRQLPYTAMAT
jgi:hypothetical protein